MKKRVAISTALGLLCFGFAGGAGAATCNLIAQDKEINFTLTRGNPEKVVDAACVNPERELEAASEVTELFNTRWGRVTITPQRPARKVARAAAPRARGFSGNTAGSATPTLVSASEVPQSTCSAPVANTAGTLEEGAEICIYDEIVAISALILEEEEEQPPAVPLPAAGVLLIAGLGSLSMLRRRRRA